MKKIIVLLIGMFCILLSNAQINIDRAVSKIAKLIARNVTTDGREPSRLQEYYIYDINLDSNGKITHIDLLKLDSSFYVNEIKKIIPLIKKNWVPVKSSIIKVIIPVIIIDNDRANKESEHNMSVAQIADFFQQFLQGNKTTKIFVSRMVIVEAYSGARKN